MKLIDVLQKMKVADLKKEISKQNIRGYSKLKKAEIIKIMTDRPDKFKYLLLQNMKQKKEILQDKVKLKEAKEKLKKLKEPKKQLIKTKTGVVTVKPKKEEPKPAPKPAPKKEEPKPAPKPEPKKDLTKNELKLINLEKEQKKLQNKKNSLGNYKKDIDEKQNLQSQIMEIKLQIFELKDKLKGETEKKAIQDEKKAKKEFKKNVQDFIGNPNDELLEKIDINFELMDDLPESLQDNFDNVLEEYENKDKKKVNKKPAPKKELSTIEEKEIFEKENLNLGTFQKYDNKIYKKSIFSFKKPVNNDKLINIIEKNQMVIIRSEIIDHFERIIYQCRENVLNLKNALKLKNKNIKWKDLSFKSGSLKDFLNEVKNQKLICLTEKQLNKILKLNILSINDINKYKATLKEEKDLMEKFENKDKKKNK